MFKGMLMVLLLMLALMSLACSSTYDRVYDEMRDVGLTESEADGFATAYTEQIALGKSDDYANCYASSWYTQTWDPKGRPLGIWDPQEGRRVSDYYDEQEARVYAAACEELILRSGVGDHFDSMRFVEDGYTEQGVRDYFVAYKEQIAQGKSEEDAHHYAEQRALLGKE